MKHNWKMLMEEFVELKELIRSQGYTVEVAEKLDEFDGKMQGFEKELRELKNECEKMIKKYPHDAVGKAGQLATLHLVKEILGEQKRDNIAL